MSYLEKARKFVDAKTNTISWEDDECKKLFDIYTAAINNFWSVKLSQYLKENCTDLMQKINESEERLEQLWSNSSKSKFTDELAQFYILHQAVKVRYEEGVI